MSRKRHRSLIDISSNDDGDEFAAALEMNHNSDANPHHDHNMDDEYMPIQLGTNPINGDSMVSDIMNDADDVNEEPGMMSSSLRALQSLGGNGWDVQADVKKKKASVLVLLPGRLLPPAPDHNSHFTTSNNKMKDETPVKIGRIEGFHRIDGTSPNANHLTLSLGDTSNPSDEQLPTVEFRGRSIPTTTTFVLLHVTGATNNNPGTTTPNHKKQVKPKVVCKGVFQNVIVFGKGALINTEETVAPTTTTYATTTTTPTADPPIQVPESHDNPLDVTMPATPPPIRSSHVIESTQKALIADECANDDGTAPVDMEHNSTQGDPKLAKHKSPPRTRTAKSKSSSLPAVGETSQPDQPSSIVGIPSHQPSHVLAGDSHDNIAVTTAEPDHDVNARSMQKRRHVPPKVPLSHEWTMDASPSTMVPTRSWTTPQKTIESTVSNVVADTIVSSQSQSNLTKTTSGGNNSSSRKRRRTRQMDATTSSSKSTKEAIGFTLDAEDDEFAFLGG